MCWGAGARFAARPAVEKRRHRADVAFATADVEQGSHQGPHHAAQEAVANKAKPQLAAVFVNGGGKDSAPGLGVAATRQGEGGEVVAPDDEANRPADLSHLEIGGR